MEENINKKYLEMQGIDPRTSRMLSERSTIWATSPTIQNCFILQNISFEQSWRTLQGYIWQNDALDV